MKTRYTGAGYLLNDDRCSGGPKTEADVLGCPHCQKLLTSLVDCGFCTACHAPICGTCVPGYLRDGCLPYVKLVDQRLNEMARERAYRRALGLDESNSHRGLLQGGVPS